MALLISPRRQCRQCLCIFFLHLAVFSGSKTTVADAHIFGNPDVAKGHAVSARSARTRTCPPEQCIPFKDCKARMQREADIHQITGCGNELAQNIYNAEVCCQLSSPRTPSVAALIGYSIPAVLGVCLVLVVVTLCVKRWRTSTYDNLQRRMELPLGMHPLQPIPAPVPVPIGAHVPGIPYLVNGLYCPTLPGIPISCIKKTGRLGSGEYGEVFQGTVIGLFGKGIETKVAIKTTKQTASQEQINKFLNEADTMGKLDNPYILKMYGVCMEIRPPLIIMELMEGGNLLDYLRTQRAMPTVQDLLTICLDVAKGCVYFEVQHFVHRDLACRNCLVSSRDPSNRVVKIGDFGLTRDVYQNEYYKSNGADAMPLRWLSPEAMHGRRFTRASDVWAFGVLVWEVFTLGRRPYAELDNLQVMLHVKEGKILEKPPGDCPDELYDLMTSCWEWDEWQRPTFQACLDTLEKIHVGSFEGSQDEENVYFRIPPAAQAPPAVSNGYVSRELFSM